MSETSKIIARIKSIRAQRGLTQKQLAKRIYMKQSAVARIESGENSPTVFTLQRIAAGLGAKLEVSMLDH